MGISREAYASNQTLFCTLGVLARLAGTQMDHVQIASALPQSLAYWSAYKCRKSC